MIFHDRCTIEYRTGTTLTATVPNVPCTLSPLNSAEASSSGPVTTRYQWLSPLDVKFDPRGAGADTARIVYGNDTLQVEGGFERHVMLGRFHHTEAIVLDFGAIGA